MPMLVNKLIFRIIPERAPFLLRPLLKGVFGAVAKQMLDPRLKIHADMVNLSSLILRQSSGVCQLTRCAQIEKHLSKTDGWFAGGQEPPSADYMM